VTTETNKVLSHFSATPEIPAFALECANDAVYIYDDNRRRTRQREKEQFRQIIDTSPVALLICERDAGIIRYTKLFAQGCSTDSSHTVSTTRWSCCSPRSVSNVSSAGG